MNKKKVTLYLLIMSFSVSTGISYAADEAQVINGGTVHFTGEMINSACTVSTSSANKTVDLGQYRTGSFTAKDQTSSNVRFNIELTNCDISTLKTASIAFTGIADATNNNLLSVNSGGNGTAASGVGIEILDSTMHTIPPNGTVHSVARTLSQNNTTIPLIVRYKSTANEVTVGAANADATFVLKYE